MNEHVPEDVTDEQVPAEPADVVEDLASTMDGAADPVRTGNDGVDAVLRSVEDLEGTPVDEHVAVFEQAHEQLRRALDAGA